jgi:hypothetical protein
MKVTQKQREDHYNETGMMLHDEAIARWLKPDVPPKREFHTVTLKITAESLKEAEGRVVAALKAAGMTEELL